MTAYFNKPIQPSVALGPRKAVPIPPDAIWVVRSKSVSVTAVAATCGSSANFRMIRNFLSRRISGGCSSSSLKIETYDRAVIALNNAG